MANQSIKDRAKKKDIAELVRLIVLQPQRFEPNITIFVQQAVANCGKDSEAVSAKKRINCDSEKLLVLFDEIFSHDEILILISFYNEIKKLVSFYQSETVFRKWMEAMNLSQ